MTNLLTKREVLTAVAHTIKGTAFIGIQAYTNAKGEKSNQTIIAGYSHEKAMQTDFISLQENQKKIFETLTQKHPQALVQQAYENLFNSLEKRLSSDEVKEALRLENDPTIQRSDAQIDAYIHLAKGVKMNKETEELHIYGLVVRKTVIEAIEYKTVNSRELTIVQDKIKKLCEFRQNNIRNFIFSKSEVKLQGITIK